MSRDVIEYPECHTGDFLCTNDSCRYHVSWLDIGNCALRVRYPSTVDVIGIALGVSKQRADVLVDRAVGKFMMNFMEMYPDVDIRQLASEIGDDCDDSSAYGDDDVDL